MASWSERSNMLCFSKGHGFKIDFNYFKIPYIHLAEVPPWLKKKCFPEIFQAIQYAYAHCKQPYKEPR